MTFNNSILLILKQNGSEEFNELLIRISPRYKNNSSANAALCRAIKNLSSMGLIKKINSRIFITDKGLASIHIEMKEKLVLRLNELMKKPLENLEEIVQLLIVFSERANESNDLLLNAKENSTFTIKDLDELQKRIDSRKDFLDKMASLIGIQEERLRELNFNDSKDFVFDKNFVKKLLLFSKGKKLVIESRDSIILKKLPEVFRKENSFIIEDEFKSKIFNILLLNPISNFIIYFTGLKIIVTNGNANIFALHETIKEFEKI
jgi:hypothetical protein